MNYCENCHVAFNDGRCPLCSTKKLRQVNEDDFCLVTEAPTSTCEIYIDAFNENDIPYSALPYGSGIGTVFALPLENYRIFVPFSSFEKAKKIVRDIDNAEADELRSLLLEGADRLNIPARREKKFRKKIKLSEDKDFIDYCINIIKNAYRIEDKGDVHDDYGHSVGRFIVCFSDEATLGINSETYEILSLL